MKEAFEHTWDGYRKRAWLHDEVKPISGDTNDPFGAWGATLVDSIDTLWIMGMKKEFDEAISELRKIDFTRSDTENINLFESTIRYIGGLLGAYDLTDRKHNVLLQKAIELGEMLYHAFDTPNHMPITRWDWHIAEAGDSPQHASTDSIVAEVGSLTLEFTRLTQLTGDKKYYDAVQRITALFRDQQNQTSIPGLFPIRVNPFAENFHSGDVYTMGGQADSLYEYLPKEYLLLQGTDETFRYMYESALDAAKSYLAFEPLIPLQSDDDPSASDRPSRKTPAVEDDADDFELTKRALRKRDYNFSPDYSNPIALGTAHAESTTSSVDLYPVAQHLTCFMGGVVALAARTFAPFHHFSTTDEDMDLAERLTAACVWSYRATPTKIGPEMYQLAPCRRGRAAVTSGQERDWTGAEPGKCRWDREQWLRAIREKHGPRMEPAQLALAESEDPGFWEGWAKEHGLREGFVDILDRRYVLRPETIESVFVMWRVTGDPKWQDVGWEMFEAVTRLTRTKYGFAGVGDVFGNPSLAFGGELAKRNEEEDEEGGEMLLERRKSKSKSKSKSTPPPLLDNQESFWPGETLKYFYLLFADPELVSLDEFVFNTEAHPFRWRKGAPPKGVDNG